ncbi:MAG TPA: TRAFs-binding domain-containing protein [Pyrinomonadaceae bacterium]
MTITVDEWLELAPKPRPRKPGQQWDVFLSYRSIHRPWVIQLYDVLRHLGYEVFLDQYVLSSAEPLVQSLDEGLAQSASGVLIWSNSYSDSEWCKSEYYAMVTRRRRDREFFFVVTKLDDVQLPPMAEEMLFTDFSAFREGPRGNGLLLLLYGLKGEAPPDPVVRLAVKVDEEVRDTLNQIIGYSSVGDYEGLMELAGRETTAWLTTPMLGSNVAESLIALKRYDDALALLEKLRGRFPKAIRPRQLQGLALARKGDWRAAQSLLSVLYAEGERDPETLGILARTWKDRYKQSEDPIHLTKSRDHYAEAFEGAPDDSYTGINAASMSVLLEEFDAAERYAERVEKLVGIEAPTKKNLTVSNRYWETATVAEVQLIRRNYERAAALYKAAVSVWPDATGSHESTRDQARLLMDKLAPPPEERDKIERAFKHLKK